MAPRYIKDDSTLRSWYREMRERRTGWWRKKQLRTRVSAVTRSLRLLFGDSDRAAGYRVGDTYFLHIAFLRSALLLWYAELPHGRTFGTNFAVALSLAAAACRTGLQTDDRVGHFASNCTNTSIQPNAHTHIHWKFFLLYTYILPFLLDLISFSFALNCFVTTF